MNIDMSSIFLCAKHLVVLVHLQSEQKYALTLQSHKFCEIMRYLKKRKLISNHRIQTMEHMTIKSFF